MLRPACDGNNIILEKYCDPQLGMILQIDQKEDMSQVTVEKQGGCLRGESNTKIIPKILVEGMKERRQKLQTYNASYISISRMFCSLLVPPQL